MSNGLFEKKKDIYNKKYILYTAWNVHDFDSKAKWLYALHLIGINGTRLRLLQKSIIDLSKNNNPKLDFINNGAMGVSTAFIGKYGYSAGGAETVGSSLLASNVAGQELNPEVSTFPSYLSESTNDLYHKDLTLGSVCIEYDLAEIVTGQGSTVDGGDVQLNCVKYEDISLALLTNSTGKDRLSKDNNYAIPYRLFWDYDHETIFNGVSKGRGSWDKYINKGSSLLSSTDADTAFISHRRDYMKGATRILNGKESSVPIYANPLINEPVFMVLERDLLWLDDLDHDGMPNVWEDEHKLDKYDSSDAVSDLDGDELNNYQEFINGTNPEKKDTDGDGFSDYTEVVSNETDPKDANSHRLNSPLNFTSSRTGQTITLNWDVVSNTKEYTVKGYKIYLTQDIEYSYTPSLADDAVNHETTDTSLTLSLEEGKTYYFSLTTIHNDNTFSKSTLLTSSPTISKILTLELTNKQTCETTGKCDFKVGIPNNGKSYNATLSFGDGGSASMSGSTASIDGLNITPTLYSYSTQTHEYQQTGTYTITLEANVDSEDLDSKSLEVVVSIIVGSITDNTFKIKKTGQNISYTKYDDGYYEKGVAIKYTKEGVNILDRATGLLWQDSDDTNGSKRSWSDAKAYCEQFNGGNWRLPTRKELSSLLHYAYYNPSIDKLFKHTKADYYWSLETTKRDATKVWVVSFSEGVESTEDKSTSYYTRCVQNNFVLTANAGADQFVEEGQPVMLRATQSPREELIVRYEWFDGDTKLGEGAELTLEADDMRDGEHNITLVVTDQDGNENNNSMTVTIVSNNKVLKKTNQNISYAKYDDGYYEKGIALNYSQKEDNILDRTTGLIWQNSNDTNTSKKSWQEAKKYCASLEGYWRLPTRKELSNLVNYGDYNPSIHKIFTYTASDYYWTVNTSIRNYDHAWIVSFSDGLESTDTKNSSHYTRCLQSNFAPTANAGVDLFIEKGQAVTLSASNSPRKGLIDSYLWESREDEIGYGETRTIPNLLSGRQNIYLTITDKKGKTDTDDLWVTIVANGTVVKKTGQTESYADHDDGDYERGHSLSYSDHGNTVIDNTTGLEWKDDENTNSVKMTWEKANEYCSQGNNTWRLPTRRELSSLVDYGTYNPSIDSNFDNTASDYYWTIENSKRDNDKAWIISFLEGRENTSSKSSSYFVRCINVN